VLECGSGNLYDALSLAVKAALHNTRSEYYQSINNHPSIHLFQYIYNNASINISVSQSEDLVITCAKHMILMVNDDENDNSGDKLIFRSSFICL